MTPEKVKERNFCRQYEKKLVNHKTKLCPSVLLKQTLKQIFPSFHFLRKKYEHDTRLIQFMNEDLRIAVEILPVEYFKETKTSFQTFDRHAFLKVEGYNVIEIPYYLQPDHECIKTLFSGLPYCLDKYKKQKMSGFIGEKTALPADFTSIGIQKFIDSLVSFESQTKEIIESLIYQNIKYIKGLYEIIFCNESDEVDQDLQDMIYYLLYENIESYREAEGYFFSKRKNIWKEEADEMWVNNTLATILNNLNL